MAKLSLLSGRRDRPGRVAGANGDDGTSTTDGLRDVSDDGFTNDGSDLGVGCATSGIGLVETLTGDGETWIGIPGGVREVLG